MLKGFASGNVVFGVGSYTYQYCTRDTLFYWLDIAKLFVTNLFVT